MNQIEEYNVVFQYSSLHMLFNILSISKPTKSVDLGQCLFCFTIPYGPACQDEQSNIQKTKPHRFK